MVSPISFRNQARDRLLGVLGVKSPVGNSSGFGIASASVQGTAPSGFTPAGGGTVAGNRAGGGGGGGRTCKQNNDCPPGKTCQGGVCADKTPAMTPAPTPGGGSGGGRTCTRNNDCPQGKQCDPATGTCVANPGGGRQCNRNNDCPPGKVCDQATGTCAARADGGNTGGGCNPPCGPNEHCKNGTCKPNKVDDGSCRPPCRNGKVCQGGACVEPDGGDDTPTGTCRTQSDCNFGESCVNGQCITPNPTPGTVYNAIEENPQAYLQNLANRGRLNTRQGTVFGNFQNNVFANIQSEYEAQGLNNPNVQFKAWLAKQARYGNPDLTIKEGYYGTRPVEGIDGATTRANNNGGGGGGDQCTSNADCSGGKVCNANGVCKQPQCTTDAQCGQGKTCVNNSCESENPNDAYYSEYQGVTPFANYLRNQYYGASSRDRGSDSAAYGAGSTRWSAF